MQPSPAWSTAFRRLVSEQKTDPPHLCDTGEWHVPLVGAGRPAAILALLPGTWELVGARDDEDLTTTVWSSVDERGVVTCLDHFQAGLFGSVVVYPSPRTFERGLVQALGKCTREFAYEEWALAK